MTEDEQFEACDALEGETMIAFSNPGIAMRYIVHRKTKMPDLHGLIAMCEDMRGGSGLCVIWRDPVSPETLAERIRNCLWLLEEILAGRKPWPQPGEVHDCKTGEVKR